VRGLREPVRLAPDAPLVRLLHLAAVWAARAGHRVILVSANDHIHAPGSLHYRDRAVDFHATDLDALADWLRHAGYRVFWNVPGHYSHVHAEVTEFPFLPRTRE